MSIKRIEYPEGGCNLAFKAGEDPRCDPEAPSDSCEFLKARHPNDAPETGNCVHWRMMTVIREVREER